MSEASSGSNRADESQGSSVSYRRPEIRCYGSLVELTQTADGTNEDGGVDPFGFPQLSGAAGLT